MKASKISFCGLLLVFSLITPGCGQKGDKAASVDVVKAYDRLVILTHTQKTFLLNAARKGLEGGNIPDPGPLLRAIVGAGAVVEIFLPPEKPLIKIVGGDNFFMAFTKAVQQLASDPDFLSVIKPRLDATRVKVGIIDKVFPLKLTKFSKEKILFRRLAMQVEDGIHGFILVKDGKAFYQSPDLVLYKGWGLDIHKPGEREKRVRGRDLIQYQLKALSRAAFGDENAWRTGRLYAFTMQSFIDKFGEPGKPVDSYRGKNMIPSLTAESLRAATLANANYLLRIVNDQGTLDYIYYPNENEYDPAYHIVRHTGYVLRLLQTFNKFGDKKYFDAAQKVLKYVIDRTVIPEEAPHIAVVKVGEEAELGAGALMAMIYSVMPEETLTTKDRQYRDKFGESILFFRLPQAGHFYTTFQQALTKREPEGQALYFPGIAMLALVRLYERTGEKKWWDAAVGISRGQKKLWKKDGHRAVGKYCWVGQAWARMARIEKDAAMRDEYRDLGYSHCDAVLKHQWTRDRKGCYPDYPGGADNSRPPRTTPTSARAESLAENYRTAKFLGDIEAQKKYGVAILRALHFVVQNQFTDENSWFLPYPEKAKGGIRGGLTANDIRIDYNQHTLAAELMALDIPDDLAALGLRQW